jgi:CubicO group peptidase (beta-lactamase class C family)
MLHCSEIKFAGAAFSAARHQQKCSCHRPCHLGHWPLSSAHSPLIDLAAFKEGHIDIGLRDPNGNYRGKWYTIDRDRSAFAAVGIHGQWIYVDAGAETVIVRVSSQPIPMDIALEIRRHAKRRGAAADAGPREQAGARLGCAKRARPPAADSFRIGGGALASLAMPRLATAQSSRTLYAVMHAPCG